MTTHEVADRLRTCIDLGSVEGVAALVMEHCNNRELIQMMRQEDCRTQEWLYWASPAGSVMENTFVDSLELGVQQIHCIENRRHELEAEDDH